MIKLLNMKTKKDLNFHVILVLQSQLRNEQGTPNTSFVTIFFVFSENVLQDLGQFQDLATGLKKTTAHVESLIFDYDRIMTWMINPFFQTVQYFRGS